MFCSNCGKKIDDGLKFCPECGAFLGEVSEEEKTETVVNEEQTVAENAEAEAAPADESIAQETAGAVIAEAIVETETVSEAEKIDFDAKAEEARLEAQRVEEEAKAAIAEAQAKADEAKAKAEAAIAEAREKERRAAMAKAEAQATSSIKSANRRIAVAEAAKKSYDTALEEARQAYSQAAAAIAEAESLGVTGLPELSAFVEETAPARKNAAKTAAAPVPVTPVSVQSTASQESSLKLLSPWAYFWLSVLYCIPVIGWIFLIIHSASNKNLNRKKFAISIWIKVIICLVICAIIAALYLIFRENVYIKTIEEMIKGIIELVKSYFVPA